MHEITYATGQSLLISLDMSGYGVHLKRHSTDVYADIVANEQLQGKAKYNKWKEVVDAKTSQKEAEDKYVELGQQILAKHDN